eukprot:365916-Chlamydomonas_euryale.AAC.2
MPLAGLVWNIGFKKWDYLISKIFINTHQPHWPYSRGSQNNLRMVAWCPITIPSGLDRADRHRPHITAVNLCNIGMQIRMLRYFIKLVTELSCSEAQSEPSTSCVPASQDTCSASLLCYVYFPALRVAGRGC